jgi:hypothetical protein
MKKLFFATGIIIFLIGAVIAVNYSSSRTDAKLEWVGKGYNNWEVSGYYKAGDNLTVYCVPPHNWTDGAWDIDDDVPYAHRHIWFEIVDPNGSITEFNTAWTSIDPGSGQTLPVGIAPCYINVSVRGEGLNVTSQYPGHVGGTVLLNGNYTARVISEFYPSTAIEEVPPLALWLKDEYTAVVYPNTYLLPLGTSVGVLGAIVSVKAGTSKKKRNKIGKTQ